MKRKKPKPLDSVFGLWKGARSTDEILTELRERAHKRGIQWRQEAAKAREELDKLKNKPKP